MQKLDTISEELFNKIRGRFPSVTIGDVDGNVTNDPSLARFFDFDYMRNGNAHGKVSISLDEKQIAIVYSKDLVDENDTLSKNDWYDFLKEIRQFARKRMLNFDTRDINKSNLNKRDYKFLATKNRPEEENMNESKMYGTSRQSYQDIGNARLLVKHSKPVNQELAAGRTQHVEAIYVENADGERFKYPYKHLNGARAMARHVAEGGKPFDDFGKHITGLSEELGKLRKFKTYMGRSSVMAESLSEYMGVVLERLDTIKKTIQHLQKESHYKQAFESFEVPMMEDVPEDVASNWIDQLTIKQFNEELKDVFPYIYNLVSEATKAEDINPDDLDESGLQRYTGIKKYGKKGFEALQKAGREGASEEEKGAIKDKYLKKTKEEFELESAFEAALGQFSEDVCEECGNQSWTTLGMTEEEIEEGERHGNSKIYDKCWKGYRKVPGKKAGEEGSCKKVESEEDAEEGNAYAQAVRQAKMDGKKKGDKVKGPDGDEITLEKDDKTPLGEFILSYYDRETGEFPKGETAVLTMIEKDYGEKFIEPAKAFIEQINQTFEQYQMRTNPQQMENPEFEDMRRLAGLR